MNKKQQQNKLYVIYDSSRAEWVNPEPFTLEALKNVLKDNYYDFVPGNGYTIYEMGPSKLK